MADLAVPPAPDPPAPVGAGSPFAGPGEMPERCRALDWAATPLGAADSWPVALRAAARLVFASPVATALWCGPSSTLLYNDAYRRVLGAKHPAALGSTGPAVWPEAWPVIGPQLAQVRDGGPAVSVEDAPFLLDRQDGVGGPEEAWFTYAFSAVTCEAGECLAVQNVALETTGRVRTERALAVERARLAEVFRQAPSFIAAFRGPEHTYDFVNEAYAQIIGHRDVVGKPLLEALPEVRDQGFTELLDRVRETGEPWVGRETPVQLQRTPGAPPETRYVDMVFQPLVEADGTGEHRIAGVVAHGSDVTEQVVARREVERLLAWFRAVQDASPNGFVIHRPVRDGGRPDGAIVDFDVPYLNEAGAHMLGRVRDEIVGGRLLALFPGAAESGILAAYARVVETGEPWTQEMLYQRDGVDAGLAFTAVRVGDEIAATFADISARLRAEADRTRLLAELSAERERLRSLILHMPAPLALQVGPEHRFEIVNDAYKRVSGGGRDVTGLTPREAFPDLVGQGLGELLDRVYATGEPWFGPETPFRYDRDGTGVQDTWWDLRFEPVREPGGGGDGLGRVVGILNFSIDVTDQVRARREIERLLADSERARADAEAARAEAEAAFAQAQSAYAEAAAANRAKSEFLAVMSHELRTPLNAIGGYAELIELGIHGPVTPEQRTALERIQRSQRHLLGLINGVLNYARVEAGAVHYAVEDVALDEVLAACEALVAPQVRAKGLTFGHAGCERAPDGRPLGARADRDKVQQVVLNLLSNAVKFTGPGGRVDLRCAVAAGEAGPTVRVAVADTGIGIAADQLARVFEPFVQVDVRLTRTQEGTGLGLAISRDLARGMGGDLTAESAPGAGSTFTLTLPRAAPNEGGLTE